MKSNIELAIAVAMMGAVPSPWTDPRPRPRIKYSPRRATNRKPQAGDKLARKAAKGKVGIR